MKCTRRLWLADPTKALQLNWEDHDKLFGQLQPFNSDMSSYNWVEVGQATIEFTIDRSFDSLIQESIAASERALADADAEYQVRRRAIVESINKLRSIGWTGGKS